nr:hypothetical protein [uncultured Pseudomonas sp.]
MASLWEPVSGVFWSSAPLIPSMEWLTNLGNSSFFTSVFGALTGAFAGAWAAQRIAERGKLREEMQKELRNINAGIALALSTVNLVLALKKQHLRDLKKSYDDDCARHKMYVQNKHTGQNAEAFELSLNLLNFQELSPPIATLQEIIMGRLSTAGRALATVTSLTDAFGSLNYSIAKRNELIERMKEGQLPEGAKAEHFYLGIPYAAGKTNNEYGSYINAMSEYLDDTIFFSLELCEDLQIHGRHIAEKYRKKFGGELLDVTTINLEQARKEDLLPMNEAYERWRSSFESPKKETLRRWQWFKKAVRYLATLVAK